MKLPSPFEFRYNLSRPKPRNLIELPPIDEIDKNIGEEYHKFLSHHPELDSKSLNRLKTIIDWSDLCLFRNIPEKTLSKHKKLLPWPIVAAHQKLSTNFIYEHKDQLPMSLVSAKQYFDLDEVKIMLPYLDLYQMIMHNNLIDSVTKEFVKIEYERKR